VLGMVRFDELGLWKKMKHCRGRCVTLLENLQWKVEYVRNEVNMLENWKSTNQILKLNRMTEEFEGFLARKRGEMANMIQETG
jgi:hypothetical protein